MKEREFHFYFHDCSHHATDWSLHLAFQPHLNGTEVGSHADQLHLCQSLSPIK